MQRKGCDWEPLDTIGFADSMPTGPAAISDDGTTLYLRDSRKRDTSAWSALDVPSGARARLPLRQRLALLSGTNLQQGRESAEAPCVDVYPP